MAFDPDRYLAQKASSPQATGGFDPDAYLGIASADRGNIINTDVPTVVGTRPNAVNPQPIQQPRTLPDYAKALYEVPATVLTGAVAPFIGVGAGMVENLREGTNKRVDRPELGQRFTYEPTSPVSQDVLGSMGEALTAAKIPAYVPTIGTAARATQQTARTAAPLASGNLPSFNQATQAVKTAPSRMAEMLMREREAPLSGVGAAEVPEVMQRIQLGRNLRVPIQFSKGEATRDLGQQAFEAEIPKSFPEIGKPLIEGKAQRNDTILQNFDAYVDATGKETFGLRETGKVVDKALVNQVNRVKEKIDEAYELARSTGETQEPIQYGPLKAYIDQQTPTVKKELAPILNAVDEQLKLNDPKGTGQISINQLEDVYQFINLNYNPNDLVAKNHVRQMKNLINTVTEGKGGENYQAARALRTKFGEEFENIGVVDKLLRTKKGTDDRAVAFEDVFKHSVLDGSLDDVQAIGRTLKKAGPEGEQAWRELQGQTIEYIKDQVTRNIDTDMYGNPVVSPAKYKSIVRELDQDGKLDYLFGKKGAQEIRDLLEATILVNAPVKGAVNQSNTASAFIRAMDKIKASPLAKLPLVKSSADYGIRREMKKQVEESLNFDPNTVAKELRKGAK
jgi:hypothetical protein